MEMVVGKSEWSRWASRQMMAESFFKCSQCLGLDQGVSKSTQVSHVGGSHHLPPLRVHISRKLASGAEGGLEPKYSDIERAPLNHCAKHTLLGWTNS